MNMALQASQIVDLANSTLNDLGRLKLVEIAADITEYIAAANLLNKERIKFDSGKGIQWTLLQNGDDNTRNVGLYDRDVTNVKDGTFTLEIPWRHTTANCSFDEKEEAMNAGAAKIVDYIATKRYQRAISWVAKMEENFWEGASSTSDDTTPFGLLNSWLDYDSGTGGFNGSNPAYGSVGGKSAATYTRLRHYSGLYTTVSDTDLVDKIRDALVLTNFKPMVANAPVSGYSSGIRRAMYSTWDVIKPLEKLLRQNNDDLGNDLDKYHGMTRIQQVPVVYAPWLQDQHATSDPVIGIDWAQFHAVFRSGYWMREKPFKEVAGQHSVYTSFLDSTYNFRCWDRRKGLFMFAKSDPQSD